MIINKKHHFNQVMYNGVIFKRSLSKSTITINPPGKK